MIWLGVLSSLLALLAWVISTLVVSRGIKELREAYNPVFSMEKEYLLKIKVISMYLGITLLTGTIILTIAFTPLLFQYKFVFSGYLVFAGIFSFSAGTSLYYFCTLVYKKAEIASQFSRVGPFFSIALGVYLFGEIFTLFDFISLILLSIGVVLFLIITWTGKFGFVGFILGVLTA